MFCEMLLITPVVDSRLTTQIALCADQVQATGRVPTVDSEWDS